MWKIAYIFYVLNSLTSVYVLNNIWNNSDKALVIVNIFNYKNVSCFLEHVIKMDLKISLWVWFKGFLMIISIEKIMTKMCNG